MRVRRGDGKYVLRSQVNDLVRFLVWHDAHGNFSMSLGRQHCLASDSGISAPDSAHIQAWPDRRALQSRVTFLSLDFVYADAFLIFVNVERRSCQFFPVLVGNLHDIIVESGYGDSSVLVNEGRNHVAQCVDRVCDSSAIMAGMKVLVRALHVDLKICHAAHSAVDGRNFVRNHCRV